MKLDTGKKYLFHGFLIQFLKEIKEENMSKKLDEIERRDASDYRARK